VKRDFRRGWNKERKALVRKIHPQDREKRSHQNRVEGERGDHSLWVRHILAVSS